MWDPQRLHQSNSGICRGRCETLFYRGYASGQNSRRTRVILKRNNTKNIGKTLKTTWGSTEVLEALDASKDATYVMADCLV